jgi:hypothetical protein
MSKPISVDTVRFPDKFNRLLVKASNNKELAALLFNIEIL